MVEQMQFRTERKQGKDGKFHYLIIADNKHGYYVHDQETVDGFCQIQGNWVMWPVGDNPWDTFDASHYRDGLPKVKPEVVMTSSYGETCNYLKVNALIGAV
ncbi:hypothetical protein SBP1_gp102 [Vibrio virus vB_VspP_SBP1]|uniref:Uncharacterized protein n=1 Tax=Vibrio virus vB_VspP_SBP1 TaxID=2500581 RepID=A0A3T0IIV5_9CAUD|nr:hypothetical protein KNU36_gp027 [Vibrio virus vB_VspP_SBP1]AZU99694.1 hypothetical protein SBP1_gp102 [Vibrio virus vB_VspP_SBP1]